MIPPTTYNSVVYLIQIEKEQQYEGTNDEEDSQAQEENEDTAENDDAKGDQENEETGENEDAQGDQENANDENGDEGDEEDGNQGQENSCPCKNDDGQEEEEINDEEGEQEEECRQPVEEGDQQEDDEEDEGQQENNDVDEGEEEEEEDENDENQEIDDDEQHDGEEKNDGEEENDGEIEDDGEEDNEYEEENDGEEEECACEEDLPSGSKVRETIADIMQLDDPDNMKDVRNKLQQLADDLKPDEGERAVRVSSCGDEVQEEQEEEEGEVDESTYRINYNKAFDMKVEFPHLCKWLSGRWKYVEEKSEMFQKAYEFQKAWIGAAEGEGEFDNMQCLDSSQFAQFYQKIYPQLPEFQLGEDVYNVEDMQEEEQQQKLMNHILYIDEEQEEREYISWLEFWVYMCKHGEHIDDEDFQSDESREQSLRKEVHEHRMFMKKQDDQFAEEEEELLELEESDDEKPTPVFEKLELYRKIPSDQLHLFEPDPSYNPYTQDDIDENDNYEDENDEDENDEDIDVENDGEQDNIDEEENVESSKKSKLQMYKSRHNVRRSN